MHEPEPQLERDRGQRERHEEGCPPEDIEKGRAPPMEHRSLIGGQRDGRQDRERDDGDGADLVADARLDRGRGPSARRARGPPCHSLSSLSLRPA